MNKDKILEKYLAKHSALGSKRDSDDKDEFDREHREIWDKCDAELQERKSEFEAKDTLTDDERAELAELNEMFPPEPT